VEWGGEGGRGGGLGHGTFDWRHSDLWKKVIFFLEFLQDDLLMQCGAWEVMGLFFHFSMFLRYFFFFRERHHILQHIATKKYVGRGQQCVYSLTLDCSSFFFFPVPFNWKNIFILGERHHIARHTVFVERGKQ